MGSVRSVVQSQVSTIVLKALESGEKYGLEIIEYVKERSAGRIIFKQPTLYSALKRLEKQDLVSSYWKNSEKFGGRRHYYSLTKKGVQELGKNKGDWFDGKVIFNDFLTGTKTSANEIDICAVESAKKHMAAAKTKADICKKAQKEIARAQKEAAKETAAAASQADFFEDSKELHSKMKKFKSAMEELEKKKAEMEDETGSTNPEAVSVKDKKKSNDDGMFIKPDRRAGNDEIDSLSALPTDTAPVVKKEELKNDAVFISGAPVAGFNSYALNEYNKSYNLQELQKTYIEPERNETQPETITEADILAAVAGVDRDESSAPVAKENEVKEKTPTRRGYSVWFYNSSAPANVRSRYYKASKVDLIAAAITMTLIIATAIALLPSSVLSSLRTDFSRSLLVAYLVLGIVLFVLAALRYSLYPNMRAKKYEPFTMIYGLATAIFVFSLLSLIIYRFGTDEIFSKGFSFSTLITILATVNCLVFFIIKKGLSRLDKYEA